MVRPTAVIHARSMHRIRKEQFKKKGVYKMPDIETQVMKVLKARNVKVTTADEILGINKFAPKWDDKPDDLLPDFTVVPLQEPKTMEHGTKNYAVSTSLSFTNGLDQACMLTNTQPFVGIPPFVKHLLGKYSIKDQNIMVQKAIMQSQVWNATRETLPRRMDVRKIGHRFTREYGIPDSKSASILLDSFLHLSGSLMKDFPKSLDRRIVYKPEVQAVYKWKDNNIQLNFVNECMLLSNRGLPLFADTKLVKSTVDYKLPSMYPISPTIDLVPMERLQSEDENTGALTKPLMFPQTVFRITNDIRSEKQNQAFNLMNTYGIALAEARQRFKKSSGDLPYPICIQNVNMTYNRINFIYFQLNTFDTDNNDGVKNTAWFDTAALFKRTRCLPWENNNQNAPPKYGSFDPTGFKKFLVVYLNGIA